MIYFTSEQKIAVYNISMLMMMIDGHISTQEGIYWREIGNKLNISDFEKETATKMNTKDAISILRSMPANNKIAALKIFAKMMEADGKIDSKEVQLLEKLSMDMDCVTAANTIGKNALESIIKSFD